MNHYIVTKKECDFTQSHSVDHKYVIDSIWSSKEAAIARLEAITKNRDWKPENSSGRAIASRYYDHGKVKCFETAFGEEKSFSKRTFVTVFEAKKNKIINLFIGETCYYE